MARSAAMVTLVVLGLAAVFAAPAAASSRGFVSDFLDGVRVAGVETFDLDHATDTVLRALGFERRDNGLERGRRHGPSGKEHEHRREALMDAREELMDSFLDSFGCGFKVMKYCPDVCRPSKRQETGQLYSGDRKDYESCMDEIRRCVDKHEKDFMGVCDAVEEHLYGLRCGKGVAQFCGLPSANGGFSECVESHMKELEEICPTGKSGDRTIGSDIACGMVLEEMCGDVPLYAQHACMTCGAQQHCRVPALHAAMKECGLAAAYFCGSAADYGTTELLACLASHKGQLEHVCPPHRAGVDRLSAAFMHNGF